MAAAHRQETWRNAFRENTLPYEWRTRVHIGLAHSLAQRRSLRSISMGKPRHTHQICNPAFPQPICEVQTPFANKGLFSAKSLVPVYHDATRRLHVSAAKAPGVVSRVGEIAKRRASWRVQIGKCFHIEPETPA